MPPVRDIPFQALIALDQLFNALTGGWADETLSARCWRLQGKHRGWALARRAVDALLFFDKDHCRESYESEKKGRQLPPEMRK